MLSIGKCWSGELEGVQPVDDQHVAVVQSRAAADYGCRIRYSDLQDKGNSALAFFLYSFVKMYSITLFRQLHSKVTSEL